MTLEPTPKTSTGKKIGYVRVSDTDQTEDLQVDALKLAGCDVIYGDHGVSGAITVRKGLDEMLTSLETGDTLVVWKLDRLGRSTIHLLQLLDDLRRRGVDFQAITQGIDTTTSVGRMLYGQLAVFAEFEREQIRERTKAGMAAAKARGKHIGRPRKLTEDQIAYARTQITAKRSTITSMAKAYGVTPLTLSRATQRR
ncbi:putative integrases/recombinase [Phaeobacter inhibens]|uniref:Integrases/recombinase n=1 Tax=Phaeobacter inhibens TaxID=221822 RepID=A0ABN5GS85_9RHOB|nr:recombinase family protein [Phaeobacter inhibens]AUQ50914.1 putative integrases/recombinase [Phaeobacter inhibens]AUQ96440.1 putative integrases/recombinase [Phaeobacter inhibens]AUR20719.1 putative integrases/recombinase [Phaeobacter inhibens]